MDRFYSMETLVEELGIRKETLRLFNCENFASKGAFLVEQVDSVPLQLFRLVPTIVDSQGSVYDCDGRKLVKSALEIALGNLDLPSGEAFDTLFTESLSQWGPSQSLFLQLQGFGNTPKGFAEGSFMDTTPTTLPNYCSQDAKNVFVEKECSSVSFEGGPIHGNDDIGSFMDIACRWKRKNDGSYVDRKNEIDGSFSGLTNQTGGPFCGPKHRVNGPTTAFRNDQGYPYASLKRPFEDHTSYSNPKIEHSDGIQSYSNPNKNALDILTSDDANDHQIDLLTSDSAQNLATRHHDGAILTSDP